MKIYIKNLRASASLGIHDWEKASRRIISINMEIQFNASAVLSSGSIADTIDYTEIEQGIIRILSERHFNLLETLLHEMGQCLLRDYEKIEKVYIEIEKPGALRQADSVSISQEFVRK